MSLLNEVLRELQQRQGVPLSQLPIPANAVPGQGQGQGAWAGLHPLDPLGVGHKKSRLPLYGIALAMVLLFLFWVSDLIFGDVAEVKALAFSDSAVSADIAVAPDNAVAADSLVAADNVVPAGNGVSPGNWVFGDTTVDPDNNSLGVQVTALPVAPALAGGNKSELTLSKVPAEAHVNTIADSPVGTVVAVSVTPSAVSTEIPGTVTDKFPESVIATPQARSSVPQSFSSGHFQKASTERVNLRDKAGTLIASRSYADALELLSADFYIDWQLRLLKAQAFLGAGSAELAETTLMAAYPSVSAAPEYFALLAGVKQKLRKYAEAEAVYLKLLDQDPAVGEWWVGLAITRDQTAQHQAARVAYEQGLSRGLASDSLRSYAQKRLLLLTQK